MNVSSANLLKGEDCSFSLFSLNEQFQEVSNNESSNTGLRRFLSESVAETLEAVKSDMYINKI